MPTFRDYLFWPLIFKLTQKQHYLNYHKEEKQNKMSLSKTFVAKVQSSGDQNLSYTTTLESCSCPSGFWRPERICKHRKKLNLKSKMLEKVIFGKTSSFARMPSSDGNRKYLTQVGDIRSCTCASGHWRPAIVCRHQKILQAIVDSVDGVDIVGQIWIYIK